jgi:hypothetical protein
VIFRYILFEFREFLKTKCDDETFRKIDVAFDEFLPNLDDKIPGLLSAFFSDYIISSDIRKNNNNDDGVPEEKKAMNEKREKKANEEKNKKVKKDKEEKKVKKPTLYNSFVKIRVASHKSDPLFDTRVTYLSVALQEYRGEMGKYVKANHASKCKENEDISFEENCRLCINDFLDIEAKRENTIAVNGIFLSSILTSFLYKEVFYVSGSYIIPEITSSEIKTLMLNEQEKSFINLDKEDTPILENQEENEARSDVEIPVLNPPTNDNDSKSTKSSSSSSDDLPLMYRRPTNVMNEDDPLSNINDIPGPDDVESDSEGMDYNN